MRVSLLCGRADHVRCTGDVASTVESTQQAHDSLEVQLATLDAAAAAASADVASRRAALAQEEQQWAEQQQANEAALATLEQGSAQLVRCVGVNSYPT